MADILSLLMGDDATAEEESRALSAALRRQQGLGMLGQLSGDKVLAQAGQGLMGQAQQGQQQLSQAGIQRLQMASQARAQQARAQEQRTDNERMAARDAESMRHNKVMETKPAASIVLQGPGGEQFAWDPRRPGGSPTPIMGPNGKPLAKPVADPSVKTEEHLRKQLMDYQETKDALLISNAFKQVQGASANGAGDMRRLYAYLKLLDPGSAVREGEFATAIKSGGLPSQVMGFVQRMTGDGMLPEGVRKELEMEARKLRDARLESYRPLQESFRKLATQHGIDPSRVVIDLGLEEAGASPGAAAGLTPEKRARLEELRRKRAAGGIQ